MAGKPKPTHLKVVTGNPGKRKLSKLEPRPKSKLPAPLAELNDDGRAEWRRLTKELGALGMTTGMDWQALTTYCVAHQLWREALRHVLDQGSMVRSPKGFPLQNPYMAVVNKQAELMLKLAGEFGFTPSARARMGMALDEITETDPAEAFFG